MPDFRCPDCGYRLTDNECPICQKRVPFGFAPEKSEKKTSPRQSNANTRKKTYIPPQKQGYVPPRPQTNTPHQTGEKGKKSGCSVALIIVVAIFVLNIVFGMSWAMAGLDFIELEPFYPEESYNPYVEAGSEGAEHVPTIEQTELYNDNGIRITADAFCAYTYVDSYALRVTVANDSDRDVTVFTDSLSVNGYMLNLSNMFCEVEAGETVQEYLDLRTSDLEDAGIDTIANLEFVLDLYDSNDYTDIDRTELITLDTSEPDDYVQPVDDSGREVYNDGSIRIVFQGMEVDETSNGTAKFFLENISDRNLSVTESDISINGQSSYATFWISLRPGTHAVTSIYFYGLEELGITETAQLEELAISLIVRDMETYEICNDTETPIVIDLTAD